VHSLQGLGDVLVRALHLLALSFFPVALSPDPSPSRHLLWSALFAAVVLLGLLLVTGRVRRRTEQPEIRAAVVLAWVACAASVACAAYFREEKGPLARGLFFVAVPAWAALACGAYGAAGAMLEEAPVSRRAVAPLVVLGLGVACFVMLVLPADVGGVRQPGYLLSADWMWWEALRRDGDHAFALEQLTRAARQAKKPPRDVAERCLTRNPEACACLELRADIELDAHEVGQASADARQAVYACPWMARATVILAETMAQGSDAPAAEKMIRTAIAEGGPDQPRLHLALAMALEGQGHNDEAKTEAARAIEMGAGRDTDLFAGALAIEMGDLDGAKKLLDPLVAKNPDDAKAQYDLALIADKKKQFNAARQGYLAALRSDPGQADARYNVAVLTLNAGAVDEAKHHAAKFREDYPHDPRGETLSNLMANAKSLVPAKPQQQQGDTP
jgi:tetratricopeptide (TPR) repeat protein